jgi:hypothetical protein
MRKLINRPEDFVEEVIDGIILAYGDRLRLLNGDSRIILRNPPARPGKVAIVTGGGSGHLPVFLGYVGKGLLDGCAVGNVFASPSSQKMFEMIKAVNSGTGVLCLYGNYGGDNLNLTWPARWPSSKTSRHAQSACGTTWPRAPGTGRKAPRRCGHGLRLQGRRRRRRSWARPRGRRRCREKALDNIRSMEWP